MNIQPNQNLIAVLNRLTGPGSHNRFCGPMTGHPQNLGNLFGALGRLFEALERIINSIEPKPGQTSTGGSGVQPGLGGGEVHDFTPGLGGGEVHDFEPGVGDYNWTVDYDDWFGDDDPITTMPVETPDPIAGSGRIWGDPHFIGADGGKYDIQGRPGGIYNLLSDSGFQMNGRFDAWGSRGATVVGEVGIVAGGNRITVEKDGDVRINGQVLRDGQSVTLSDGTTVAKDGRTVSIESAEWDVSIKSQNSRHGNYLNIDVSTENAIADGVKPHGLLGQTFDGDGEARNGDKGSGAQGGGAIETVGGSMTEEGDKTTVGSYEVGSMHAVGEGLFSRYGPDYSIRPYDQGAEMNAATARLAFGVLTVSMLQAQFTPVHMNNGQAGWINTQAPRAW